MTLKNFCILKSTEGLNDKYTAPWRQKSCELFKSFGRKVICQKQ